MKKIQVISAAPQILAFISSNIDPVPSLKFAIFLLFLLLLSFTPRPHTHRVAPSSGLKDRLLVLARGQQCDVYIYINVCIYVYVCRGSQKMPKRNLEHQRGIILAQHYKMLLSIKNHLAFFKGKAGVVQHRFYFIGYFRRAHCCRLFCLHKQSTGLNQQY